ncbi:MULTISPECIES: CYTH and CHAD domain-containing protein [Psychrobacter]|uniref:Adenylate cyclase n=1 Tax=Psychrobacter alimentarius TaxID=261164 RepID=A0ABM5ZZZ1_9GAMM|nr:MULTISPECIES: CYTH and CHAD domain-containing protein [Psychrobacter]AMT97664.1 Adenylate cyclase [Psychrobacter alimentarius]QCB30045.1 CYTH and CHAD domain-containing protein [Psychrobacter sp. PAMC27889]
MQEIELKFLVPESRLKGLMRQVQVKSSKLTQLAAHYYDTLDQQLAKAGIGLRIRKEGDAWVQTLKAGGDGIAARLEHNAILDNEQVQAMLDNNALMPDLGIYKDTPAAAAFDGFKLKELAKKLTQRYVTDVERTTRFLTEKTSDALEDSTDNCIEVAYDQGEIIHGEDDTQREAIQEIEFELISGDLDFLFTTAKAWCKRYKLSLSTVTKAERGGLLIRGQSHSQAIGANLNELNVSRKTSLPTFVRAAVHNCLIQILPNSSAIVAGSTDHEHILQFYIGIDRLLTAITTFASFSDEINPDWQPILKQTLTLLDDYRELTYLAEHLEPQLQELGAPATDWTTDIDTLKIKPMDAVKANDFQLILLELIAFTMSDPKLEPQNDKLAIDKLAKILSQQYKDLLNLDKKRDDIENSEIDDTQSLEAEISEMKSDDSKSSDEEHPQYELYRQLKTLRYMSEFSAPVFHKKSSKKKTKLWLKNLTKAQKALNKYQAYTQYQQRYQLKSASDSNALYGAGWIIAALEKDHQRAEKRLMKLKDGKKFW